MKALARITFATWQRMGGVANPHLFIRPLGRDDWSYWRDELASQYGTSIARILREAQHHLWTARRSATYDKGSVGCCGAIVTAHLALGAEIADVAASRRHFSALFEPEHKPGYWWAIKGAGTTPRTQQERFIALELAALVAEDMA